MDRKSILILVLALTMLFGGIFSIAKSINNKKQENNFVKKITTEQERIKSDMLAQVANDRGNKANIDTVGDIKEIGKKTQTIYH